MKKLFSLIGVALLASSMLLTSCGGEKFTITAESADATMGTVTGGGEYALNATVVLTATANDGYEFVCWNDGNTDNPRTITVTENASYVATFQAKMTNGVKVAFNGTEWTAGTISAKYYASYSAYDVYSMQDPNGQSYPIADVCSYATSGSNSDTYGDNGWENSVFSYLEYYKDQYLSDGTYQYGDWWGKTATINVTAFDATALTISANVNATMFDAATALCGDDATGIDAAPTAPMTVTMANVAMESSKAAMKKFNGQKLSVK